jgi:hypothetical protein
MCYWLCVCAPCAVCDGAFPAFRVSISTDVLRSVGRDGRLMPNCELGQWDPEQHTATVTVVCDGKSWYTSSFKWKMACQLDRACNSICNLSQPGVPWPPAIHARVALPREGPNTNHDPGDRSPWKLDACVGRRFEAAPRNEWANSREHASRCRTRPCDGSDASGQRVVQRS